MNRTVLLLFTADDERALQAVYAATQRAFNDALEGDLKEDYRRAREIIRQGYSDARPSSALHDALSEECSRG